MVEVWTLYSAFLCGFLDFDLGRDGLELKNQLNRWQNAWDSWILIWVDIRKISISVGKTAGIPGYLFLVEVWTLYRAFLCGFLDFDMGGHLKNQYMPWQNGWDS